jgi:hypothetical protein
VALPGEVDAMTGVDRARVWLARTWWLLMPPFTILVIRLVIERATAAPYDLLPSLTRTPLIAWALAGLYLSAHAWLAAAGLFTIERTGALVPTRAAVRIAWGGDFLKLAAALAIFVLEYAPIPLWQAIGRALQRS